MPGLRCWWLAVCACVPAVTAQQYQATTQPVCHCCTAAAQIVGAMFGALLVAGLVPNTSVGMGDGAPGGQGGRTKSLSALQAGVQ
jgi:hypothetical protein